MHQSVVYISVTNGICFFHSALPLGSFMFRFHNARGLKKGLTIPATTAWHVESTLNTVVNLSIYRSLMLLHHLLLQEMQPTAYIFQLRLPHLNPLRCNGYNVQDVPRTVTFSLPEWWRFSTDKWLHVPRYHQGRLHQPPTRGPPHCNCVHWLTYLDRRSPQFQHQYNLSSMIIVFAIVHKRIFGTEEKETRLRNPYSAILQLM